MRAILLAAGLTLAAFGAHAQDAGKKQTLADVRTELNQLTADLQSLRSELVAQGPAGFAQAGGDSAIDRMNTMEARLAELTGQTEQLQNRIDRVVKDGTTRIGDIEFRLCEMEEGCDIGSINTPTLGDQQGSAPLPPSNQQGNNTNGSGASRPAAPPAGAATKAEKADFDRAREVLGQGDFRRAADLFAAVAEAHAGGPLTAQALFLRGSALDSAGDLQGAGEAWLASFAADPNGPQAADALLGLSRAVAVSAPQNSCPFLYEITTRFPDADQSTEARKRIAANGCDTFEAGMAEPELSPEAESEMGQGEELQYDEPASPEGMPNFNLEGLDFGNRR